MLIRPVLRGWHRISDVLDDIIYDWHLQSCGELDVP
jgi:hypothetical protein